MSRTLSLPVPDRLGWLAAGALVGVLGAVLLSPGIAPARAQTDTETPEHTLAVSGTGIATVKPDIADVTLGVTVQRDKAGKAAEDAAKAMDAVITAVKNLGVAEDDIQTVSLNLNPVYNYDRGPERIVGYAANNLVTVTVREIGKTGEIIDAATGAGATDVNSVSFRVDDQTAAEEAAREEAIQDARAKADTLAAAAGVSITGVVSISETSDAVPYPVYYGREAAAVAADGATTPVMGGTIDVSINVSVVYSIP